MWGFVALVVIGVVFVAAWMFVIFKAYEVFHAGGFL